jgi:hypothetical protein
MTAVDARQVTPRDLWLVCDRLTNPTRERLTLDTGTVWIRLPSLWLQLYDLIDKNTGDAGNGKQQSRPPLNTAALSLLLEIAADVRDGCHQARLKRSFDVPRDIRAIVSDVIRRADPDAVATSHALIRGWVARIKATLPNNPDRTWRMRGACRVCSSTTVPVWEDGEELRAPALIVHSEGGVIDKVSCDFCGSELDGDELTQLLYDTLKRPAIGGMMTG